MNEPGDRAVDQFLEVHAPPQPFAPEEDRHVPFRLTRVRQMLPPPMSLPSHRRPLWCWAVAGFVCYVARYAAMWCLR
jgi:hypothetical protein